MPGVLIHAAVGVLGGLIIYFFAKKLEFSLAFFIGTLLPDGLKMLFVGLYENSPNITTLIASDLHSSAHAIVNGWDFVVFSLLFFLVLGWLLYHFHFIKKKKLKEWDELVLYMIIGYGIHVLLDAYVHIPHTTMWL